MAMPDLHLLLPVLLAVAALAVADWLLLQRRLRRARKRRVFDRYSELRRERERSDPQRLNTRGDAP